MEVLNNGLTRFWVYLPNKITGDMVSNVIPYLTPHAGMYSDDTRGFYDASGIGYPDSIYVKLPTTIVGSTVDSVWDWLIVNVVEFTYHTGTTYQLEPQAVQTVLGQNNIYTDSGEVSVWYISGL